MFSAIIFSLNQTREELTSHNCSYNNIMYTFSELSHINSLFDTVRTSYLCQYNIPVINYIFIFKDYTLYGSKLIILIQI